MASTIAEPQSPRRETIGVPGWTAVVERPEQVVLHSALFSPPAGTQIRVRLEGCGVCGSNVPVWEGRPWFDYPREPGSPGHEGWGIIDAVGENVDRFRVGDRVALLSYAAFATHDFADQGSAVKLPATLANVPFPGEAIGCAVNVVRRCQIRAGEAVAVVGIGFLGALVVQLASAAGARVVALSRRASSRQLARQLGAFAAADVDESARESLHDIAPEQDGFDCVIEATGFQQPLDVAAHLVRTRGRLVIAGYHQDGVRTVNMQSWNWRGIDVINAHERDSDEYVRGMQGAVEAVEAGQLQLTPLMSHAFPLSELDQALKLASARPDGFIKAIVHCT